MKTSAKIWIDKTFAGFVARVINIFVIALGKLLRIDHSLDKSFKVIAVCKYKGMGSILQSVPLLKTLRVNYPDSSIIYVSSEENRKILEKIQEIDEIITINEHSIITLLTTFPGFLFSLVRKRIEVFIDLEVYSNFSTVVILASISKNRMGFYISPMHYRLGNYTHMMYYNTRNSIAETYLQFARLLNCKPLINEPAALKSDLRKIKISDHRYLDLLSEKYILINPNASDLRIERRWDSLNFSELIKMIHHQYPEMFVVLTGSSGEAAYVNNILEETGIGEKVYSLAGKTDINGLIALIQHSGLFITNDSGPMHIAFSTNTPVVALFGPCSPVQYGHFSNCHIIYKNLYCSPCVHEFVSPPCRGNNYCMKAISVYEVFEKVENILSSKVEKGSDGKNEMIFKMGDFTIGTLHRKGNRIG